VISLGGGYGTEILDGLDTVLGELCRGTKKPAGYDSCTFGYSGAVDCASGCRAKHRSASRFCVTGGSYGARACDSSSDHNYYASACSKYGNSPDHDWTAYAHHDEGCGPNGDAGHARCELRDDPSFSHHRGAARFTTGAAQCSRRTAVYRCSRGIGCSEYERGFDQHEFNFKFK